MRGKKKKKLKGEEEGMEKRKRERKREMERWTEAKRAISHNVRDKSKQKTLPVLSFALPRVTVDLFLSPVSTSTVTTPVMVTGQE